MAAHGGRYPKRSLWRSLAGDQGRVVGSFTGPLGRCVASGNQMGPCSLKTIREATIDRATAAVTRIMTG